MICRIKPKIKRLLTFILLILFILSFEGLLRISASRKVPVGPDRNFPAAPRNRTPDYPTEDLSPWKLTCSLDSVTGPHEMLRESPAPSLLISSRCFWKKTILICVNSVKVQVICA
jgi:hypothetical protein